MVRSPPPPTPGRLHHTAAGSSPSPWPPRVGSLSACPSGQSVGGAGRVASCARLLPRLSRAARAAPPPAPPPSLAEGLLRVSDGKTRVVLLPPVARARAGECERPRRSGAQNARKGLYTFRCFVLKPFPAHRKGTGVEFLRPRPRTPRRRSSCPGRGVRGQPCARPSRRRRLLSQVSRPRCFGRFVGQNGHRMGLPGTCPRHGFPGTWMPGVVTCWCTLCCGLWDPPLPGVHLPHCQWCQHQSVARWLALGHQEVGCGERLGDLLPTSQGTSPCEGHLRTTS